MPRPMLSKDELDAKINSLGLKKRYKYWQESETGCIVFKTKKPPEIKEGYLYGSEIDLWDDSTFRIWTCQLKKANAYAKSHNLRIRPLDGEAELFVPISLADDILPEFGAKVKRSFSEEHMARMRERSPLQGANLRKSSL